MSVTKSILLAGASRGVGREIAKILISQNINTIALLRSNAARTELEQLGATVVLGDALNYADLEAAIAANPEIDTIISTIGGVPQDGQRADYLGNKYLIDAAKQAGIQRFILVSSIGAGATKAALPDRAYQALAPLLAEKERAENALIDSGLTYTIIRPGGLKSEPATGNGVLTIASNIAGSIHREDVAILVCSCLNSDRADNTILSAFDRNLVYEDIPYPEFILH